MGLPAAPILLTRTPYGRSGPMAVLARLFAARGYQVIVVSCRGTFGSTGDWEPFGTERADGLAVFDWLAGQPWFVPNVGLWGGSYFGFTQWAVAADAPTWVRLMVPAITASDPRRWFYRDGAFALQTALVWLQVLAHQEDRKWNRWAAKLQARRRLNSGYATLPLADADLVVADRHVRYYRAWLADESWPTSIDPGGSRVTATRMVTGWYDPFVRGQVEDFRALRAAGRLVQLTVGPWVHASLGSLRALIRATLDAADTHLLGRPARTAAPVDLHVMGSRRWISLDDWPPATQPASWYLHGGGQLRQQPAGLAAPSGYRYDPATPTPSIGGAALAVGRRDCGARNNRRLMRRADVLTFATAQLDEDITVIGEATVTLYVRSSLQHTDFVARLCDASPRGRSVNVCDGIFRFGDADPAEALVDGTHQVRIRLGPTACTFRRGHRLQLLVCSGAHPLYDRNPGTGQPLATATHLAAADQLICHDRDHPSCLTLPVLQEPLSRLDG